ncbi:MAG: DUF5715 family protein [Candidatus Paceibacterota bacterium]|jgi:hypothetical protein
MIENPFGNNNKAPKVPPATPPEEPNLEENIEISRREFLHKMGAGLAGASVASIESLILPEDAEAKTREPSLKGSRASIRRMVKEAVRNKFDKMRDSYMVSRYVKAGYLVHLSNAESFILDGEVSFPYARPATKLWLQRFSRQFLNACGEKLVVTSLLRTLDKQPKNASPNSVHPTGMALDLKVPESAKSRQYLERNLLLMEKAGFLEATREHHPPHYHVAVFSDKYLKYVKAQKKGKK